MYMDSWEHAQSKRLQKLPHIDLLHFKIQSLVSKISSWAKETRRDKASWQKFVILRHNTL